VQRQPIMNGSGGASFWPPAPFIVGCLCTCESANARFRCPKHLWNCDFAVQNGFGGKGFRARRRTVVQILFRTSYTSCLSLPTSAGGCGHGVVRWEWLDSIELSFSVPASQHRPKINLPILSSAFASRNLWDCVFQLVHHLPAAGAMSKRLLPC
jgi:hypothetical protein